MLPYRRDLKKNARRLRTTMTDGEQRLWSHLRGKQIGGVQFYRQKPIGSYIVDFYAPSVKLVVELDGSQHFETDAKRLDEVRDNYLRQKGLTVMRFDSRQVLVETEGVLTRIWQAVEASTANPPRSPFVKGGGYERQGGKES